MDSTSQPSPVGSQDLTGGLEERSRYARAKSAAVEFFFLIYKVLIGPALHTLGGAGYGCRYHPTCAEFARQAFEHHSAPKAFGLSFLRLLRCNPWTRRDFEYPVPVRLSNHPQNTRRTLEERFTFGESRHQ